MAQTSASHTVNIGIDAITVIAISGDPMPMMLDKVDEADRATLRDETSFYNLTTNTPNVLIIAELDFPMPDGVELWLAGETSLGRSSGRVILEGQGQQTNIVSNIGRGLENGRTLQYELVANEGVGVIPFQSRLVTLSIVDSASGKSQQVTQTISFGVALESAPEASN